MGKQQSDMQCDATDSRAVIVSTMAAEIEGDESASYKRGYQDAIKRTCELIRAFEEMDTVETDPHMAWFKEWKATREAWCRAAAGPDEEWDMPAVRAAEAETDRLSALISNTVAKTREGMMAQVEYWIADWGDNNSECHPEIAVLYSLRTTLKKGLAA